MLRCNNNEASPELRGTDLPGSHRTGDFCPFRFMVWYVSSDLPEVETG